MESTKVLGIDYGMARIGLAISDGSKTLASHYLLLRNNGEPHVITALSDIIQKEHIDTIIIGLPLGIDSTPTQMSDIIELFIANLKKALTSNAVTIIPLNETVSSYEAYENLLEKGFTHTKAKELVDIESARIILQEYLDNKEQL